MTFQVRVSRNGITVRRVSDPLPLPMMPGGLWQPLGSGTGLSRDRELELIMDSFERGRWQMALEAIVGLRPGMNLDEAQKIAAKALERGGE